MRLLARLLFALWFAVVLGDPGMLHSCPMHGGGMAHGAQSAEQTSAQPSAHAAHGAEAGAPAGHGSQPDAAHHCSCASHCSATPIVAPLSAAAAMHVPVAVAEARHPRGAPSDDAPASPDLRLPFANGPPAV
jgi:hypothetical protein